MNRHPRSSASTGTESLAREATTVGGAITSPPGRAAGNFPSPCRPAVALPAPSNMILSGDGLGPFTTDPRRVFRGDQEPVCAPCNSEGWEVHCSDFATWNKTGPRHMPRLPESVEMMAYPSPNPQRWKNLHAMRHVANRSSRQGPKPRWRAALYRSRRSRRTLRRRPVLACTLRPVGICRSIRET